ncbi:hypothetical protein Ae201684P_017211 [Aphanomyces euteiches]|nr:hypothetical protein Ae201684P_017211 [Aphanomyces euteiches]
MPFRSIKCSIHYLLNPTENDARPQRDNKTRQSHRECEIQGCMRYIVSRKRCVRHGGGPRYQSFECQKGAKFNGLCWMHGGSRACHVEGCSNRIKARGLCWAHGGGKKCQTLGCTTTALRSGHCWARGGGKRCLHEGCSRPGYERLGNFCTHHSPSSSVDSVGFRA